MPMTVSGFKCFIPRDASDKQSEFEGLLKIICLFIDFFSFPLNQFLQSEIRMQISSSV